MKCCYRNFLLESCYPLVRSFFLLNDHLNGLPFGVLAPFLLQQRLSSLLLVKPFLLFRTGHVFQQGRLCLLLLVD